MLKGLTPRVTGCFLEDLDELAFDRALSSVLDAIAAMDSADTYSHAGFGPWDVNGRGAYRSWHAYLLDVDTDTPGGRTHGWRRLVAGNADAEEKLGIKAGATTNDGQFTLEEVECIALCGQAPCLTVNWRFFGDVKPADFDKLVDDLGAGRLSETVPPHGTLCRVRRAVGLVAKPAGGAAS